MNDDASRVAIIHLTLAVERLTAAMNSQAVKACGEVRRDGDGDLRYPDFPCVLRLDHDGKHIDRDGDDWS